MPEGRAPDRQTPAAAVPVADWDFWLAGARGAACE